jgi:hypothetical protein
MSSSKTSTDYLNMKGSNELTLHVSFLLGDASDENLKFRTRQTAIIFVYQETKSLLDSLGREVVQFALRLVSNFP